jgi:ribonuclease P protein component
VTDAATNPTSFSFARRYRLTRAAEFARVFNDAQRSADRYFTVLFRSNHTDSARLGFAVAKKQIPAAVGRNRVRRLARESFRKQRRSLPPVDIIILARSAAAAAANSELLASLDRHWQRLQTTPERRGRNS